MLTQCLPGRRPDLRLPGDRHLRDQQAAPQQADLAVEPLIRPQALRLRRHWRGTGPEGGHGRRRLGLHPRRLHPRRALPQGAQHRPLTGPRAVGPATAGEQRRRRCQDPGLSRPPCESVQKGQSWVSLDGVSSSQVAGDHDNGGGRGGPCPERQKFTLLFVCQGGLLISCFASGSYFAAPRF